MKSMNKEGRKKERGNNNVRGWCVRVGVSEALPAWRRSHYTKGNWREG